MILRNDDERVHFGDDPPCGIAARPGIDFYTTSLPHRVTCLSCLTNVPSSKQRTLDEWPG